MTSTDLNSLKVTPADILAASEAIKPFAVRTPLLSSPALDAATGARVFLKPEMLQRTGSFKFRGAYNKLSSIPAAKRAAGVVAQMTRRASQDFDSFAKLSSFSLQRTGRKKGLLVQQDRR